MTAFKPLTKFQLGRETTRGTPVAATRRILGQVRWRDASELVIPEADYGLYDLDAEAPVLVRTQTEFSIESDLSYEQILQPLLALLRGGVTPTGAGADKTWTFTAPATTDPNIDSFTAEFEASGPAGVVVNYKAAYCVCTSLEITAEQGPNVARMSHEWVGRGQSVGAITTLPVPTRRLVPAQLFTVKFAGSFAALSTAPVLPARVLSFTWRLQGVQVKHRLTGTLDHAGHIYLPRRADLTLNLDLTDTAETERTSILRGGGTRFVRLEAVGPALGGSNYRITIDGAYVMETGGFGELGDETDSQGVVTLTYRSRYDAAAAKSVEVVVVNAETTV